MFEIQLLIENLGKDIDLYKARAIKNRHKPLIFCRI